jgi:hypothetical protein
MLGKRDKKMPYKATIEGDTVALGASAKDAKDNGLSVLFGAYRAMSHSIQVRVAKDGSIIVGRITDIGPDGETAEYCFFRPDEQGNIRSAGSCIGRMSNGERRFSNLREYMDYVVIQYNS